MKLTDYIVLTIERLNDRLLPVRLEALDDHLSKRKNGKKYIGKIF